jgi:hypothetical protein
MMDPSELFGAWHKIMVEECRPGDVECVYHYTNAQGALGVLSSRKLWATHYQYMNDPLEARVALPVIKNFLTEVVAMADGEESANQLPPLDQVRWILGSHVLGSLEDMHSLHAPMVTSFSSEGDSLTQWRLYGDDGRGYAIGLDASVMRERLGPEVAGIYFWPVVYKRARQRKLVARIFESFVEAALVSIIEKNDTDLVRDEWPAWTGALLKMLLLTSAFIKHNAYSHEKEWRLVVDCMQPRTAIRSFHNSKEQGPLAPYRCDPDDFKEQMRRRIKQYKLRTRDGTFIPYIEVGLDQFGPHVLKDLMAGPLVDRRRDAEVGILELLIQTGNWLGTFKPGFSRLPYTRG